jgi:hypothetical protein
MNTHYKNNRGLITIVLGLLDKLLHQKDVYQVKYYKNEKQQKRWIKYNNKPLN